MQVKGKRGLLAVAVGAVVAGLVAAPPAAADSEFCTGLTTIATKCEKQGDVEINDSLSHANSLPTFQIAGGSDYGPYVGANGGGAR
jgi:hypothetical protein